MEWVHNRAPERSRVTGYYLKLKNTVYIIFCSRISSRQHFYVGSTVSSCGKHCAQMLNIDNALSYSHDNPNTLKHHLQVDCVAILHWFEENNM